VRCFFSIGFVKEPFPFPLSEGQNQI